MMNAKPLPVQLFFVTLLVALVQGCNSDSLTDAETEVSHGVDLKEARAIARDAYVFSFPQVYYYRYAYDQAVNKDSSEYFGGFNRFKHYGLGTPDQRIGVPNNDTPYSRAWVNTRSEPWVLTMPPAEEGRFYSSVWADFWGFVVDYPGSVLDDNEGGDYLLAHADWDGEIPQQIRRVIRGETYFLGTVTRTQAFGPEDVAKVAEIQKGYNLQPLSAYLGKPTPSPAPSLDWPVPAKDSLQNADTFFPLVNFLLTVTTPHEQDAEMYERMARIGVKAGEPWNQTDDELRQAIQKGVEDGFAQIKKFIAATPDATTVYGDREFMGTRYLDRAAGILAGGLAPNVAKQAFYFQFPMDDHGDIPDGSKHRYTMTFPPGKLPPVDFFWSVTSYRMPERWLVENPIDRYSIGSRTQTLEFEPDGSLVIYLQRESPGPDKEGNWLPIYNGPIFEILRLYGPHADVLDGTWQSPKLVRVTE